MVVAGRRSLLPGLVRHVLLAAVAVLTASPLAVMALVSLSGDMNPAAAATLSLANYREVFEETAIVTYMLNGAIVSGAILAAQIGVGLPAAYVLAVRRRPWTRPVLALAAAALIMPVQAILIPLYLIVTRLDLTDTLAALVLPSVSSPLALLLFHRAIREAPRSLFDAARLDGLGEAEILVRVVVPVISPVLTAFAIFSVVLHWNDYVWPLVVLTSPEKFTPPMGVVYFSAYETGVNYGPLMAAATLVVAPLVVFFLFAQGLVRRSFAAVMMGGGRG